MLWNGMRRTSQRPGVEWISGQGERGLNRIFLYALLALAAALLVFGVTLPIMRFEQFYFFSNEPSLLQVVGALWADGNETLAALVAALSILFPAAKLVALGVEFVWPARSSGFFRRAMPHLSRWSMMDVMLVAIVIFAAKTSGLATAVTLPGFWCYAASAIVAAVFPSVVKLSKIQCQPEKG
jgi:paraquat-inducible protein A